MAGEAPDATPSAAGWYLLAVPGTHRHGDVAWFLGDDGTPGGVCLPLRNGAAGADGMVVLLARPTRALRIAAAPDDAAGAAPALRPIGTGEAVRRMLDGLRREDGARDWPLCAATLARMGGAFLRGGSTAAGNVLVATYLGRRATGARCRVASGWRRLDARLEPLEQLRVARDEAGNEAWETLGDDPKMRLAANGVPVSLSPGWYRFRAKLARRAGRVAGPVFYAEYDAADAGVPAVEAIELPTPGGDGAIDNLVMFKQHVRVLRFDPTTRQARFDIADARLDKVGRTRALARMLSVRDGDGRLDLRASARQLSGFLRAAAADGVSTTATAAFNAYRRQQADRSRTYADWVRRHDAMGPAETAMLRTRAARLQAGPTFSILLPAYETPERWLRACIESVLAQAWPAWELCVVDDASPSPHVRRLVEQFAARDPRVRLQVRERNGHIAAASNTALEMARGDYVALLDHDDVLRPHALLEMAEAIVADPRLALLYSDEDKVDEAGRRFDPYFKPDWNPDLLLGQNYVCHLCVLRADLAREVGGFREGYEGSQDHDLVLRASRAIEPGRIHHVPRVLYHWRAIPGSTALERHAKDYAATAGARAVRDHVALSDPGATVEVLEHGHYRVRWSLPDPAPLVSIIVPTRDRAGLLSACVESLLGRTGYPAFEVLVVDNQSTDADALALLDSLAARERVRVLRYDAPFNYSAINNWAARQARGTVLALLNNDIEVITPDWLSEMASQALRPGIGAVGAMLLYPDDRIQHAGVVLGLGGVANHAYTGEPAGVGGHGGRARVAQSMSAVTGACLVVARDRYEQVGGLDERLAVAFNDIDFCLRLGDAGYRNLWTPFARLYHHESATRGSDADEARRERFLGEVSLMEARWGHRLERDPAYNPNFSLDGRGFELADPPRA